MLEQLILQENWFKQNRFLLPIRIMALSLLTGRCCPGTGEAAVNKRRIDRLINKLSSDNSASLHGQQDTDWTISLRSPRSFLPALSVKIKSRCFREHGGFVLKKKRKKRRRNKKPALCSLHTSVPALLLLQGRYKCCIVKCFFFFFSPQQDLMYLTIPWLLNQDERLH